MNIATIRATPVNIPFRAPYRFSYGSIASLTKTVIELVTDQGIVGLGECADGDRSADVMQLGERLKGLDIRDIATAERRSVPGMRYTPWGNVMGARRAFGGIEIAMWDARGKIENLPLSLLLGRRGPPRNSAHRIFQLPPSRRVRMGRIDTRRSRPLLRAHDRGTWERNLRGQGRRRPAR